MADEDLREPTESAARLPVGMARAGALRMLCTRTDTGVLTVAASIHAVDLVDRQLAAYNRRDLDGFAACYTDDVELWTGSGRLIARGMSAFREHYGRLFADNPSLRGRLVGRQIQGSVVVDHEHLSGREGREPFFAFAVFEATSRGIRRVWFHFDEADDGAR